ncbi:MAG: hypothetical protein JXM73_18685, partial [Anaerolineae bacterium]|nr:hypothetical protein [Anaerolineae bacterium]
QAALRLREALGHWQHVANLAAYLGDLERAAQAHERLGRLRPAAEMYEEAAQQVVETEPLDEARVADLYAQAARLYDDLFDEERAAACHRQVYRCRRLPEILVRGEAEAAFVEHQWHILDLQVENAGYGLAREIALTFEGPFEVRGETRIRGLRPQKKGSLKVHVRSYEGEYGLAVPLDISVIYQDQYGTRYELMQCIPVHVVQQGILPGLATPVEIHIGELFQAGATKEVGDRVIQDIQRTGVAPVVREPGERATVRRDVEAVRRCPHCNLPIREQEFHFCPDCGAPLEQAE